MQSKTNRLRLINYTTEILKPLILDQTDDMQLYAK